MARKSSPPSDDGDEHGSQQQLPGAPEPPKGTQDHPDAKEDFRAILSKYIDEDTAGIISEHIAATGTPGVFHNAEELLQMLAKFPRQLFPSTRKQFLDHWIALNKMVVPEDYDRIADKPAEVVRNMKSGEKYAVDKETGDVRTATTADAVPLTEDEAERLSEKVKKAIAERKRKEDEAARQKKLDEEAGTARQKKEDADAAAAKAEPSVTLDEHGEPVISPKAKTFTPAEVYILTKARAQGDNRTPTEIITEKVNELKMLGQLAGITPTAGATQPTSITELLAAAKTMADMMSGAGNKTTDPVILQRLESQDNTLKALQEQNKLLQQQLQQNEKQQLLDTITKMAEDAKTREEKLRSEIATAIESVKAQNSGITEIGVLNNALNKAHEGAQHTLDSVVSLLRGVTGRPPSPMDESARKTIVEGVGKVLAKDAKTEALAKAAGLVK